MTIWKPALCLVLGAGLANAAFADEAAPAAIEVAEVAVCTKVEDRTPVDAANTFASTVDKLYCFTDVRNASEATQIFHRWYVGDELVAEVPMTVSGPRWRCWSEKNIATSWTGDCRVEIVTEEGDVIGTRKFDLDSTAAAPPAAPNAPGTSEG